MSDASQFEYWFRRYGFADPPELRPAQGNEVLYRTFGGATSKITGSFYTFEKPSSSMAAELSLNVAKWGNQCLYVATFHIKEGTPMYVGKIYQGYDTSIDGGNDVFFGGNRNAEQVWIEYHKAMISLTLVGRPERLLQDGFIVAPPTVSLSGERLQRKWN